MKIDLKNYYKEKERLTGLNRPDGPVITISREYGCEANRLVGLFLKEINGMAKQETEKWKYVNKEIMDESSVQLGLNTSAIDQRILRYSSGVFSDIFSSFDQHYKVSDHIIIDKVKEIVKTYAKRGNVVIVGRGGGLITKGIKSALRIRLIAPLNSRVIRIAKKRSIPYNEAEMLVKHFDENRIKWMENLSGTQFDAAIFDLIINVETLSDKEILKLIVTLMKDKGMLGIKRGSGSLAMA